MAHITVLQNEAVQGLSLNKDSVIVDCTLGAGGHAAQIVSELGPNSTFIGCDTDPTAIEALEGVLTGQGKIKLLHTNFAHVKQAVMDEGIVQVDGILADLGWRSEQFEDASKGFSFQTDTPLLMTYGDPDSYVFTAYDVVNSWEEESIADIIYNYGEERFSRRIAKAIVSARESEPITSSLQLATIVNDALPPIAKRGKTHPATKTFQAIRIVVNDEFGVLKTLLEDGFQLLAPKGRMAIISFHSLEDRIVKQYFRSLAHDQQGTLITKKPIVASEEELKGNPRARSAKLRIIEKL